MRVLAYHCPDAPLAYRWCARPFVPSFKWGTDADGKKIKVPADDVPLPIFFHATTKDCAIAKAEAHWAQEQAKLASRDEARERRREAARLKRKGVG